MRLIDADRWIEKLNEIIADEEAPNSIKDYAVFLINEIETEITFQDMDKAKGSSLLQKY